MNTAISMINSESRVWSRWTPSLTNRPLTQGAPNTQIKIRYQDHWEENDDDFEIKRYVMPQKCYCGCGDQVCAEFGKSMQQYLMVKVRLG